MGLGYVMWELADGECSLYRADDRNELLCAGLDGINALRLKGLLRFQIVPNSVALGPETMLVPKDRKQRHGRRRGPAPHLQVRAGPADQTQVWSGSVKVQPDNGRQGRASQEGRSDCLEAPMEMHETQIQLKAKKKNLQSEG
ncbi:unnamed protein product [Parajaminaea phylloscopi]